MIGAHVQGTRVVSAGFRESSASVRKQEGKVVRKHAQLLLTRIRGRASGRPGPNAPTGDYRRSWSVRYSDTPVGPAANVGTNAPQGRRLELGFTGVDSLGRVYDQPPFPHVEPAVDETEPGFVSEMESLVTVVVVNP